MRVIKRGSGNFTYVELEPETLEEYEELLAVCPQMKGSPRMAFLNPADAFAARLKMLLQKERPAP